MGKGDPKPLEVGRELDEYVSQHVLGCVNASIRCPSTDLVESMRVVRAMAGMGWECRMGTVLNMGTWWVMFEFGSPHLDGLDEITWPHGIFTNRPLPEAICRAAVAALEDKERREDAQI